jgi:hypothetical protein
MCKVCEQAKKLEECASKIPIGMAFTKDRRRAKQAAKMYNFNFNLLCMQ